MLEPMTRAFLEGAGLWGRGARIVAAVSGGVDSAVLLHVLASLRREGGYTLYAAHLDHGLRAVSADDAAFTEALARSLAVPCTVGRARVRCWLFGESEEMAARRLRRGYLLGVKRALGADAVLTAHHGDDQLETMLLRFTRGTSPTGLAGMRPMTEDGFGRPLLQASRKEIEAYARLHGISWREDETNGEDIARRNLLRHHVTPVLKQMSPAVIAAAGRLSAQLFRDDDFIRGAAAPRLARIRRVYGGADWPVEPLHPAVMSRVAVALMDAAGMTALDHGDVETLTALAEGGRAGEQCSLTGGFLARRDGPRLAVFRPMEASPWAVPLAVPGTTETPLGAFTVRESLRRGEDGPFAQHFDADLFPQEVLARNRRAGDLVFPLGMAGHMTLKKAMNARHLPAWARDGWPLLAVGERVLWVPGANLMDRAAACTDETKRYFLITYEGMVQNYGSHS